MQGTRLGIFGRKYEGVNYPLAFGCGKLDWGETNYSVTERVCLALVWAIK